MLVIAGHIHLCVSPPYFHRYTCCSPPTGGKDVAFVGAWNIFVVKYSSSSILYLRAFLFLVLVLFSFFSLFFIYVFHPPLSHCHGIVPLTGRTCTLARARGKQESTGYRFDMEHASEFFNLSMGLLALLLPVNVPPPPLCPPSILLYPPFKSLSKVRPTSTLAACLSIYLHIFVIFRDVNP